MINNAPNDDPDGQIREDCDPPARIEQTTTAGDVGASELIAVANGLLTGAHPPSTCAGQAWGCWVHSPKPHSLAHAPIRWREDKGSAERICDHGIGHPDPHDAAYWWTVHHRDVTRHSCDDCCAPRPDWASPYLP